MKSKNPSLQSVFAAAVLVLLPTVLYAQAPLDLSPRAHQQKTPRASALPGDKLRPVLRPLPRPLLLPPPLPSAMQTEVYIEMIPGTYDILVEVSNKAVPVLGKNLPLLQERVSCQSLPFYSKSQLVAYVTKLISRHPDGTLLLYNLEQPIEWHVDRAILACQNAQALRY